MKDDYSKFQFTYISQATLDVPDDWSKVWVLNGPERHQRLRRQQGEVGIVVWAGTIGAIMVGPWRVADCTKITAYPYIAFLKEQLKSWVQKAKNYF